MRVLAGMAVFTVFVVVGVVGMLAATLIAVALIPIGLLLMPLLMLVLYLVSKRPRPGWTLEDAGARPQVQISGRRRTPTEPEASARRGSPTDIPRRRAA